MSLSRRNPKRDANEPDVVKALRKIGAEVYRISGAGLPDLLVYFRGRWQPLEVKSKGGKLTEAQAESFMRNPFPIVRDAAQAIKEVTK